MAEQAWLAQQQVDAANVWRKAAQNAPNWNTYLPSGGLASGGLATSVMAPPQGAMTFNAAALTGVAGR